eukprot:TRINITY_DN8487_c0_g1_i1.p1 TRINITY_DN8487_c0_g1~~TRINITY_DN8487_c0_g1_i1.p1  ORF type:complete len:683 (+),score=67.99 TRINITY_DN8487_c0_g1_i1:77-2125(+)
MSMMMSRSFVLLFLCLLGGAVHGATKTEEHIILQTLYNATMSQTTSVPFRYSWFIDADPDHCLWIGVRCDDLGENVVSLFVPSNVMSGTLPPELEQLEHLKEINFSFNNLQGTIPQWLSNRTWYFLFLNNNHFQGTYPYILPVVVYEDDYASRVSFACNDLCEPIPTPDWCRPAPNVDYCTKCERMYGYSVKGYCEEGDALRDFYDATGGDDWVGPRDNWRSLHPCSMKGVTCALGYVRVLNLAGYGLTGTLPTALNRLRLLNRLDLSNNFLSGTVAELMISVAVTDLNLSNNNFSGPIPQGFATTLPFIQILDLSHNNFDSMPTSYPSTMIKMDFSYNQINFDFARVSDYNLEEVYNMQHLDWSHNSGIVGEVPGLIGVLIARSNMQFIDLSHTSIDGRFPSTLNLVSTLTYIDLSYSGVRGNLPQTSLPPSLSYFNISHTNFDGPLPNFPASLQVLDVSYTSFTGSIPLFGSSSPQNSQIRQLILSHSTIGGMLPSSLASYIKLEVVDLSYTLLSGTIPSSYGSIPVVQRLDLSYNKLVSPIPAFVTDFNINDRNNTNGGGVPFFDIRGNTWCSPLPSWCSTSLCAGPDGTAPEDLVPCTPDTLPLTEKVPPAPPVIANNIDVRLVVGVVIGGVAFVLLVAGLVMFFGIRPRRKYRRRSRILKIELEATNQNLYSPDVTR